MQNKILEILRHPNLDLDVADPESRMERFVRFCKLWQKWNEKINLTSEKDWKSFFEKHVFDSLQYARLVGAKHAVLDIGSGAGFPGIPLKILHGESPMVLAESQRKRAGFLNTVGTELKFSDYRVLNARVEDLAGNLDLKGRFDRVLFRAVGDSAQCLEWGSPFLQDQGLLIIKKPLNEKELAEIPPKFQLVLHQAIEILDFHGKPSQLLSFQRFA